MTTTDDLLHSLVGNVVTLDLVSSYIVLGTLKGFDHRYLVMEEVDVHDLRETKTTRERYLMDCTEFGVRANRKKALVNRQEVVCMSLLSDVITE
jgi:small nuclear ribonucleoprotein (snRNP)-like protein